MDCVLRGFDAVAFDREKGREFLVYTLENGRYEDLSPLAVEDLHQQKLLLFNVYLAFSSNPSFRDSAAQIAGEY
ncbi:hypothetical protein Tco_0218591 [Tanacetum coccineum]